MRGPGVYKRFMFQGDLGKGRFVPFGPKAEVDHIPAFALDLGVRPLAGEIRARLGLRQVGHFLASVFVTGVGVLMFIDPSAPFEPVFTVFLMAFGVVLLMAQALLLSRRCRIAVEGGMVHVQQRHGLFAPLTKSVPLSEYAGVGLARLGPGNDTGWSVMLAHADFGKTVPLAWRRRYRDIAPDLGRYAAALGLQVLEMAADGPQAIPADAIDWPVARKVARGILTIEDPGPQPADVSSEVLKNGSIFQFTPKQRLVLAEKAVVLEARRFRAWSPRWRAPLAEVLNVHLGTYVSFRRSQPAVAVRTADGLLFTGPCPSEGAARWLKATIIAAAVA